MCPAPTRSESKSTRSRSEIDKAIVKHDQHPGAFILPRPRPVPARQYRGILELYSNWTPAFAIPVEENTQLMSQATVYVPMRGLCFIVEDDPIRRDWFCEKLGTSRIYGFFDKPEEAIAHLTTLVERNNIDCICSNYHDHNGACRHHNRERVNLKNMYAFFLDHDLGGPYQPPYATDIAKFMVDMDPKIGLRTVIHSANEPGARNLQAILPGAVYFPFGFFDIQDQPEKT